MCRDGIPPKICAAVIILALSSGGAKRKYFQTSAQGLLINVTLQFHSRGWSTIPGVPSKKKWNSTGWFCPPPPSPSIGVGIIKEPHTNMSHIYILMYIILYYIILLLWLKLLLFIINNNNNYCNYCYYYLLLLLLKHILLLVMYDQPYAAHL